MKQAQQNAVVGVGFTPGPWRYDGMWSLVKAGKYEIAAIHAARFSEDLPKRKRLDEASANARLIASAPDLLSALELAKATIERLHRYAPGSANGTLDVINSAISKATGNQ